MLLAMAATLVAAVPATLPVHQGPFGVRSTSDDNFKCPDNDGHEFNSENGKTFMLGCDARYSVISYRDGIYGDNMNTYQDCLEQCSLEPRCTSFGFNLLISMCFLHDITANSTSDLTKDTQWMAGLGVSPDRWPILTTNMSSPTPTTPTVDLATATGLITSYTHGIYAIPEPNGDITCPENDGQNYTASTGDQYSVRCGQMVGNEEGALILIPDCVGYGDCMEHCSRIKECVGFSMFISDEANTDPYCMLSTSDKVVSKDGCMYGQKSTAQPAVARRQATTTRTTTSPTGSSISSARSSTSSTGSSASSGESSTTTAGTRTSTIGSSTSSPGSSTSSPGSSAAPTFTNGVRHNYAVPQTNQNIHCPDNKDLIYASQNLTTYTVNCDTSVDNNGAYSMIFTSGFGECMEECSADSMCVAFSLNDESNHGTDYLCQLSSKDTTHGQASYMYGKKGGKLAMNSPPSSSMASSAPSSSSSRSTSSSTTSYTQPVTVSVFVTATPSTTAINTQPSPTTTLSATGPTATLSSSTTASSALPANLAQSALCKNITSSSPNGSSCATPDGVGYTVTFGIDYKTESAMWKSSQPDTGGCALSCSGTAACEAFVWIPDAPQPKAVVNCFLLNADNMKEEHGVWNTTLWAGHRVPTPVPSAGFTARVNSYGGQFANHRFSPLPINVTTFMK
ncbi:hypothetical protein B0T17DRAFT_507316 [Bombardia bombarda]|uniref:Apple domain-containing protein n=1 Tax=Bombardia bombarda TaxID=252184 RepID=A0AA39XBI8_9PEZI|nr:hypothetical protein B0T17DRAFT_507316 [Bombardia bombarda]